MRKPRPRPGNGQTDCLKCNSLIFLDLASFICKGLVQFISTIHNITPEKTGTKLVGLSSLHNRVAIQ